VRLDARLSTANHIDINIAVGGGVIMAVSNLTVKIVLRQRDYFTRRRRVINHVRLITENKLNYLPVATVLEILEYDVKRSSGTSFTVTDGSEFVTIPAKGSTARREGVTFRIDPLLTVNKQQYVSLRSVNRLFNVGISFNSPAARVCIRQPSRYITSLQGDTLRSLSKLLSTTIKRLLSANKNLKEPIPPGIQINIPTIPFNELPARYAKTDKNSNVKQVPEKAPLIIASGRRFAGTPYRFGADPYPRSRRFDCSSYIQYIFGLNGERLPRTSRAQARVGRAITQSQVEPGDLIFFRRDRYSDNRVGHVGIDIGKGQMLNTYKSPPGVTVTRWRSNYWLRRYITAREIL
jgi:peptidoglycan endopeptidase LytE